MGIIMKNIVSLLFVALLLCSNGCITYCTVHRAQGYTSEWVQVKEGDKTFSHKETTYVIQQKRPKEEDQKIDFSRDGGFAYKPNGVYYVLLPLTVPADIVTAPFQFLWFWGLDWGSP